MNDTSNDTAKRAATIAAHAGALPAARIREAGSIATPHVEPISQTSVYDFPSIAESEPALAGDGVVYARNGLPNEASFGRAVAALEGGEAGLATTFGMSAIAAAALAVCRAGDRVVVQRDVYGGTSALFERDLRRFGVAVALVDAYDPAAVRDAIPGAALVLVESRSNPLLRAVDLPVIARACREAGAKLVVDNTFATPLACRPLDHGADLVVHSASKFLAGHHDVCLGAIAGPAELVTAARAVAIRFGFTAKPFDAWLAARGLRTLDVRMRRAWATAAALAERLRAQPQVARVYAAESCALVSFDVGSRDAAEAVIRRLELITLTPSLGGVTTTASHPATSSHRALSPESRRAAGIGEGLLRLSIGIEDVEDVWGDLSQALSALP